jgi:hypothetical protein
MSLYLADISKIQTRPDAKSASIATSSEPMRVSALTPTHRGADRMEKGTSRMFGKCL